MRIIARLDVKPPYVVKPIHFEGLRKIGQPKDLSFKYYNDGADEIVYIDIVSSLYKREIQFDAVKDISKKLYVPFATGGGIKSVDDASKLIQNGVDKIILNTFAINNSSIIKELVEIFGSQAICVHIQAKKFQNNYICYTDCGRIPTDKTVLDWAKEAESLGAGEIILSSIDTDGTRNGFDLDLSKMVLDNVNIPVILGSGAGNLEHILEAARLNPSGIAIASMLHQGNFEILEIKEYLRTNGIEVYI